MLFCWVASALCCTMTSSMQQVSGAQRSQGQRQDPQPRALTPTQIATFDELLAVGGARPYAQPGLVDELRSRLASGTGEAMSRWTEPTMWLSKAMVFSVQRCEGAYLAERSEPRSGTMFPAVAVGLVAHRAIQLAHTHPNRPVDDYVTHSVAGCRAEEKFEKFWSESDLSAQSDVLTEAVSRVTGFLDSWPPLAPAWTPRFEEPIQAKAGKLTLSGRVDLLLGRPRPDQKMTMLIADWKSGALRDYHHDEASFYALVCALRHGIPPYRSTIYSLASGTWTDPDVDAGRLRAVADQVCAAVAAIVDLMTERRPPQVLCGAHWCGYCSERGVTEPVGLPAAAATGSGISGTVGPQPAVA